MDNIIRELILDAASNGMWSLLATTGLTTFNALKEYLSKADIVTKTIEAAAKRLADDFRAGQGRERTTLIQFLKSPELESIIRQLYATGALGKDNTSDVTRDSIRREFLQLLSLHLDITVERLEDAADPLFHALVTASNVNLTRTIGQGELAAHEALATYRHRRLLDELATVERNLAALANASSTNIPFILAFEEKYRKQVGARHSHIQPPHFDSARKVPIDELFVAPHFFSPSRRKRRTLRQGRNATSIEHVLSNLYRLVVIGNPGAGKSTLSTKVVHDMATRYANRPVAGRQLTPVLVILREYGRLKKANNCSILQFIELQANSNYQIAPPP